MGGKEGGLGRRGDCLEYLFASFEKVFCESISFSVTGLSVRTGEQRNLVELYFLNYKFAIGQTALPRGV